MATIVKYSRPCCGAGRRQTRRNIERDGGYGLLDDRKEACDPPKYEKRSLAWYRLRVSKGDVTDRCQNKHFVITVRVEVADKGIVVELEQR